MKKTEKYYRDIGGAGNTVKVYSYGFGEHLTLKQAAYVAGLKPTVLRKLIAYELIEATEQQNEPLIHENTLPEIMKMVRLHYDLGIGWNSMGVVLDLLRRIEELEKRLTN